MSEKIEEKPIHEKSLDELTDQEQEDLTKQAMGILQQETDPKIKQVLDTLNELLNDTTFLENFRERIFKD
ncbi:MAG TPA: hypothetical protein EYF94_06455 [Porticoccaceae bacterium]|jgi:hypothetical protein|nr:hypothetical protein [Porticoccaceae bacterium]